MPLHEEPTPYSAPASGYLLAVGVSLLAVLVAATAERLLQLADLSLVFMLAVLLVAARTRTGPAVLTALLCFLAYNFFFIEPRYTLYISASHGVATVVLFLAAALLAGRLASQLAMKVRALHDAHGNALALQELAQRLAVAADEEEVAKAAREVFKHHLQADAWVRLDEPSPRPSSAGASDAGSWKQQGSASEHGWLFLPLRTPQQSVGVIGVKLPPHVEALDGLQHKLVHAMADDITQAVLRARLVRDLQAERVAAETERLRTALLSSVSHDLRTPLAAIIGAADSLDSYGDRMGSEDRHALLDTVRSEGERLDRYIQNLLDMTRLGHGALVLERDWIGVDELIGSAIGRLHRNHPGTAFSVHVEPGLAPIHVHPALIEQALFNVIENAAKFSPPEVPVAIDARRDGERLRIDVSDCGPGIPEAERRRIFDMFYSVERGDRGRNGTGLGLAICRGMIGAHGGDVEAMPGPDGRGTTLRITLPMNMHPAAVS
jgi:two-component system sensor histidine kinase KdpD